MFSSRVGAQRVLGRVLFGFVLCGLLASRSALGSGFFYDFREVFSGTPPTGTPPWLVAEFRTIQPGNVQLTLTAPNLSDSENVRLLFFNLNSGLNPRRLDFEVVGSSGSFTLPAINTGKDLFRAGSDGYYDMQLSFATDLGFSKLFTAGDSLTLKISGIPDLDAEDFKFMSKPAGGYGPYYAAAHVQRIGSTLDSGWIYPESGPLPLAVPEPSSGLLLLLGSAVGVMRSLRPRKA